MTAFDTRQAKEDVMTSAQTVTESPTRPVRTHLIELVGVEKTYRMGRVSYPALRGVDLAVEGGELVAVVGPSGSGKTTILNMITRPLQTNRDRVRHLEAEIVRLERQVGLG